MCPDSMPWRQFPWSVSLSSCLGQTRASKGEFSATRYVIGAFLYSVFRPRIANLTSARPIRTNRPHAQVAELVDALASGASGLTAVKVRVLSWAPFVGQPALFAGADCRLGLPAPQQQLHGLFGA